jgi:hypothetical protein
MLAPILQMLFDPQLPQPVKPTFAISLTSISGIKDWLNYAIGVLIVNKGLGTYQESCHDQIKGRFV